MYTEMSVSLTTPLKSGLEMSRLALQAKNDMYAAVIRPKTRRHDCLLIANLHQKTTNK